MRIIVSGGGSAGHISPTLAVCDELKQLDSNVELLYVGQADSMEARIVAAAGMRFEAIKAGKFRRLHDAKLVNQLLNLSTLGLNAKDALRVVAGVAGAIKIIRQFKPDVIFIKGGYVGLPVGLAARLLRVPFVIHESDISPGLTNRILSKWAHRIAVGFPLRSYREFDRSRLVYTGNPIRPKLLDAHRLEGVAKFKLDAKLPVLLVMGGSQGAAAINDAIIDALPELLSFCQIIHITGEGELERVKFNLRHQKNVPHQERYHPYGFLLVDLAVALAAADLVVSRAGANTLAELAALRKPTILIPNYLMAGHQVENAKVLSRQGAVRVLDEQKLTPAKLVGEVKRILSSPEEQEYLAKSISELAKVDAAEQLAKLVLTANGEEASEESAGGRNNRT